jgi:hypothetical protein
MKSQIVEHLDRYFSCAESAADLGVWARTQSIFANPKALDNSEDWMVSNALALMSTVADAPTNGPAAATRLHEARQFLTGEAAFPEDAWPAGLLGPQAKE